MKFFSLTVSLFLFISVNAQERKSAEAYGIKIGVMQKGPTNSIIDVAGVKVGQVTLIVADSIRTGVTDESAV